VSNGVKTRAHQITPDVELFGDQFGAAGPKPPAAFLTTLACDLANDPGAFAIHFKQAMIARHSFLEGDAIVVYIRYHREEAHKYLSPTGPSEAVEGH